MALGWVPSGPPGRPATQSRTLARQGTAAGHQPHVPSTTLELMVSRYLCRSGACPEWGAQAQSCGLQLPAGPAGMLTPAEQLTFRSFRGAGLEAEESSAHGPPRPADAVGALSCNPK